MPGYSSRPPTRGIPLAKRLYRPGKPCPRCHTEKPNTARPGLCAHCLDARDRAKANPE